MFSLFVPAPLLLVIAGSTFAAVVEPFSGRLDDSLPVPLLSGGFPFALRYVGAA